MSGGGRAAEIEDPEGDGERGEGESRRAQRPWSGQKPGRQRASHQCSLLRQSFTRAQIATAIPPIASALNSQRSIRDGQAVLGTHFRPATTRMLESTMSFRITAVITTLAGFPLADMVSDIAFRSGLKRMAERAGIKSARRSSRRPPRMCSFPCHLPDWRDTGASPAKDAACLFDIVPSSGISTSMVKAVISLMLPPGFADRAAWQ